MGDPLKYVATLDLGTNTFNLVISEQNNPFPPVFRAEKGVFIGKGGFKNKTILPAAVLRAQNVLNHYLKTIKEFNVVHVKAVATEAIRNAKNGDQILEKLDVGIPFSIEKISGNREAELTWSGVKASGLLSDKTALIIDIGEASTEIILADKKSIKWLKSYKVGVSRALESYPVSDLPTGVELTNLQNYFSDSLTDLTIQLGKYKPELLIGTAGSFDTWRKILETQDSGNNPYYRFNSKELRSIIERINITPYSSRAEIKGIPEIRRESIVPAGMLILYLMDIYTFNTVYQCSYSLAEGMIYELTKKQI